ncbi:MAG: hypothetical protein OEZ01_05945, partial [Candidatus Heimdallarchaeota archaeon]|nr:hypothetical protein [Candidatus Heimdallarchaeota archaeon]
SKHPENTKSLLDFIIVANILHTLVMLYFSQHPLHIIIDVGGISLIAIIPLLIYPWDRKNFLKFDLN